MLFTRKKNKPSSPFPDESLNWIEDSTCETEGQLAVDVYQTKSEIVLISTIAGVGPEDVKISLHHDLLTIKGFRETKEKIKDEDYLYRECYWGDFSRSLILPFEVDNKNIEAEIENGLLTIRLKKTNTEKIKIVLKE